MWSALQLNIENGSVSWILFSLVGYASSDDIETELEKGRTLDLNKIVLMALGG